MSFVILLTVMPDATPDLTNDRTKTVWVIGSVSLVIFYIVTFVVSCFCKSSQKSKKVQAHDGEIELQAKPKKGEILDSEEPEPL